MITKEETEAKMNGRECLNGEEKLMCGDSLSASRGRDNQKPKVYLFGSVKAPSASLLYKNLPVEKVVADVEDWLKTKTSERRKGAAAALFRREDEAWGEAFAELVEMFCADCDARSLWEEYHISLEEDNNLIGFGELKDGDIFMKGGEEWIKFGWKGFQAVKRSGGKEFRKMGDDEMVQYTGRNYGRKRTIELVVKGGAK